MELKKHPRIVELRLAQIYDNLYSISKNAIKTQNLLSEFIDFFNIENKDLLNIIFRHVYKIKANQAGSADVVKNYRRQNIIAAMAYGVNKRDILNTLLLSESSAYRPDFNIDNFYNENTRENFEKQLTFDVTTILTEELLEVALEFIQMWHILKGVV